VCPGSTTAAPETHEQEEQRLQQLQQQLVNWQKQLITNQSVLQEHVDMPLQSLQVGQFTLILHVFIFDRALVDFLCKNCLKDCNCSAYDVFMVDANTEIFLRQVTAFL
jgi:hypothetical protein